MDVSGALALGHDALHDGRLFLHHSVHLLRPHERPEHRPGKSECRKDVKHVWPAVSVDQWPTEEQTYDGAEVEASKGVGDGARAFRLRDELGHDVDDSTGCKAFTEANDDTRRTESGD